MEPAGGEIGEVAKVAATTAEVGTKTAAPVVENVAQVAAPAVETAAGITAESASSLHPVGQEAVNNLIDQVSKLRQETSDKNVGLVDVSGNPLASKSPDTSPKTPDAVASDTVTSEKPPTPDTSSETNPSQDSPTQPDNETPQTTEDTTKANEAEVKLPAESPTIPERVANDPEYKKTWGDLYEQSRAGGKEVNLSAVDRQALSEYYDKSAKAQLENGLPQEIANDPLYQQKLGESMTRAQNNGEPLDGKKLSQEALAKYQQEKDLKGKKVAENKAEQPTTDEQLQEVQQRIGAILENNKDNLESAMVNISAKDLVLLLKALAETKEPDPKKKENKLMLILKLLGAIILSGITETAREVNPLKTQG
ncbi:MAG: hypothetical protein Q8O68_01575 [Candidatus Daviesbacteria bacterium]|nr:hypothetical protein [Candidatus Daviesbacteria bacterium]